MGSEAHLQLLADAREVGDHLLQVVVPEHLRQRRLKSSSYARVEVQLALPRLGELLQGARVLLLQLRLCEDLRLL